MEAAIRAKKERIWKVFMMLMALLMARLWKSMASSSSKVFVSCVCNVGPLPIFPVTCNLLSATSGFEMLHSNWPSLAGR